MFKALKDLFTTTPTTKGNDIDTKWLNLATVALLVHAARLDGHEDETEHAALARILQADFSLTPAQRDELLQEAKLAEDEATDLYRWTRTINESMEEAEKIKIIEQLWTIILADHKVDDYEAHLIRRVAGLIHVPDRLAGEARKRIEAKLEN